MRQTRQIELFEDQARPPSPVNTNLKLRHSERSEPARRSHAKRPKAGLAGRNLSWVVAPTRIVPPTLLRLRHNSQVRFRRLPATRIFQFGLIIRNTAANDDVVAGLPVHRS